MLFWVGVSNKKLTWQTRRIRNEVLRALVLLCFALLLSIAMEGEGLQQQQQQGPAGSAAKSLQELASDGQKHLESVVEAAHDILLTLNRALCSPSFWVAPSSQQLPPASTAAAGEPAGSTVPAAAGGDGATVKDKTAGDDGEGLAALDATRVRYKAATAALRATVAAIVKSTQEGDIGGAENMDTGELDYLEQRAADLREEVVKKNQILKVHIDQLRALIADISMWQAAGL